MSNQQKTTLDKWLQDSKFKEFFFESYNELLKSEIIDSKGNIKNTLENSIQVEIMNSTKSIGLAINSFAEFEDLKQTNKESFLDAAQQILIRHNFPLKPLTAFSEGTNIVFSYDNKLVIKLFPPFHQNQFVSERLLLKALAGKLSVKTPILNYEGDIFGWPYIIITQLEGSLLETIWHEMDYHNKLIIIKELGALIKEVHSLPIRGLEAIDCHWQIFISNQISNCVEHHKANKLPINLLQEIPHYIAAVKDSLLEIDKPVILTGEYTPMNFLVTNIAGIWHISGLIDFGDAMLGSYKYDLLGPGAFLIQGDKRLLKAFLNSYGFANCELNMHLSQELTALMLLHKYSNLEVQVRIADWKNKIASLKDLANLVWGF